MIIRLGMTSSAGTMLVALLVISPCAMGDATVEPPIYMEPNVEATPSTEKDILLEPVNHGEQLWDGDFDSSADQKAIKKRHLATLARDGDMAAVRLHRDWWNHAVSSRGDEDQDGPSILKRTLASLARQGDLAVLRNPQYEKRYEDGLESDPESTYAIDDDELTELSKRNLASLARQGDEVARRINYQTRSWYDPLSDRKEDDDLPAKRNLASLARDGDAAARRLGAFQKRPWEGEAEYDDQSLEDTDGATDYDDAMTKRNLAAMARDGDPAALRLYLSRGGWTSPDKRHLGALAREGTLKTMMKYGYPRPSNYGTHDPWHQQPKRQDGDGDEDEPEVGSDENQDPEEPLTAVKKHIAALARRGSLINLRFPRRPTPSNWYKNGDDYDTVRSNGGYKRNIQSLARTAPAGSGFRSSSRGRFWSPYESSYYMGSRHRSRSQERGRGVRSTREGYMDILPRSPAALAFRPAYRNYDAFRAPMAFVSRHMSKRASDAIFSGSQLDSDWDIPEEPFQQSAMGPSKTKASNEPAMTDGTKVTQKSDGQTAEVGQPAQSPKTK